eukprot:TRINITY_DN52661_c0_g1_i1.p1 TRINITY_DN52661_c0_g1~~TRINITY_DN52661_c0_g1_i1.p1  ORF type:complete len:718 (+),score=147.06 TRINITY_DN52661_c0_g1_i1:85-2238(+)
MAPLLSTEDLRCLETLDDIRALAGVKEPVWQRFSAALGDVPDVRLLSLIPEVAYHAAMGETRVEASINHAMRGLTAVEMAQLELMRQAAQRKVSYDDAVARERLAIRRPQSSRNLGAWQTPKASRSSQSHHNSTPHSDAPRHSSSTNSLERSEASVADADFWCRWVEKKNNTDTNARHLDQATVNDLYDFSSERLEKLFRHFDTDNDGSISHEELASGLRHMNFDLTHEEAKEIASKVTPHGGAIQMTEFDAIRKRLRLAELFTPSAGMFRWSQDDSYASNPISSCSYNAHVCSVETPHSEADLKKFFFERRVEIDRSIMRWTHVDATAGVDRLTILRLAAKTNLNAVAIDDVMDHRTTTKIDRWDDNYVLAADIMMLGNDSYREAGEYAKTERVRIHRSHILMFLKGPHDCDRLLTIYQERPDESTWLSMWRNECGERLDKPKELWHDLLSDLKEEPPRRMREESCDFLVYEILHRIAAELRPITDAYAMRLGHMNQWQGGLLPARFIGELTEVQLELSDLSRSLRPLRQVVRHIIDDANMTMATRMYLEGTEDDIDAALDDLQRLAQMAKCLEESQEKQRDKSMNDTLYILSTVSAVFLPAQFITGVYGMNFVNGDGKPTLPELTWPHGYLYFWCLVLTVTVVALSAVLWLSYGPASASRKSRRSRCSWLCCFRPRMQRLVSDDSPAAMGGRKSMSRDIVHTKALSAPLLMNQHI